jgi:hypothetical protein
MCSAEAFIKTRQSKMCGLTAVVTIRLIANTAILVGGVSVVHLIERRQARKQERHARDPGKYYSS